MLLLVLAATSLLCSLAFVLAPVHRDHAEYGWPSASGAATPVAVPLMLSRPTQLTATLRCADVLDAAPGSVLLATSPIGDESGSLAGALRVTKGDDGDVRVRTGGAELTRVVLPAGGDCHVELSSSRTETVLRVDGEVAARRSGDVRPDVAGVFTSVADPGGMRVDLTADTVFQTRPTALKVALGGLAVLTLAGLLVLLLSRRGDAARPGVASTHAGSRLTRLVADAGVVGTLAVWTVVGPLSVDDGYIAGIVRSTPANGYIGNAYRWFNAPEAPFGWFYEVLLGWSQLSASTVWMRLPSSLLGIASWLLLGRGLLPRLGTFTRHAATPVIAGLAFLSWWLPTDLGLRPEAWVAAGLAATLVLVERGLASERLVLVAVALVVAGATLAVTPTGAVAFLPVLAAAVPVLRLARRSGWGLPVLAVVGAASVASALLLMFPDQSLAAVRLANDLRVQLPGAVPWYTELDRWQELLSTDAQGTVARRVSVVLTVAAVVGLVWQRLTGALPADVARPVVDRLAAVLGLGLVVLLFTPTKWTMHFGAFVPVGAALLVVALHAFGRRSGLRAAVATDGQVPVRSLIHSSVAVTVVLLSAAVCWTGWNRWPYLSDLDVPWHDMAPLVLGLPLWNVFLLGAAVAALGGAAIAVWLRGQDRDGGRLRGARWVPSAGTIGLVVVVLTVALQPASFIESSWKRRDTYSLASDAASTLQGRPCGLAERLSVERDPSAGLLRPWTAAGDARLDGFEPTDGGTSPTGGPALTMAGVDLPGWAATGHTATSGDGPASLTTGWYRLPHRIGGDALPLVVTLAGDTGVEASVTAEFGVIRGAVVSTVATKDVPDPGDAPAARDARLDLTGSSATADVVRLIASDGGPVDDLPLDVSVPRVPVVKRFTTVVEADRPALVDWPVAFVFPCQRLAVQSHGLTDVPRWRIAAALPDRAGDIVVAQAVGGPYASAAALVDQRQVPVYQDDRPLERPITLYEWVPKVTWTAPEAERSTGTVEAWAR